MTQTITDQMNRQVELDLPPRRIVSLVPSQTELLADLGLEEEVVGITKFCVHPVSWFRSKTRVGGTKQLELDKIRELRPDLIIGNREENTKDDIEALEEEFPVWMSDVVTWEDALEMIETVGLIAGKQPEAIYMVQQIREAFARLKKVQPLKTAYFIWQKPLMAVGRSTFIHTMLQTWGLQNIFGDRARYPETSMDELLQLEPDLLLLSTEPYPFKTRHAREFEKAFPNAAIAVVDGELFSWYGSRLLQVPSYLNAQARSLNIW